MVYFYALYNSAITQSYLNSWRILTFKGRRMSQSSHIIPSIQCWILKTARTNPRSWAYWGTSTLLHSRTSFTKSSPSIYGVFRASMKRPSTFAKEPGPSSWRNASFSATIIKCSFLRTSTQGPFRWSTSEGSTRRPSSYQATQTNCFPA